MYSTEETKIGSVFKIKITNRKSIVASMNQEEIKVTTERVGDLTKVFSQIKIFECIFTNLWEV